MAKFDEHGIDINGAMEDYVEWLTQISIDSAPRAFHEYALAMATLRDHNELERAENEDDIRAFQYYEALAMLITQALVRAAAAQRHY